MGKQIKSPFVEEKQKDPRFSAQETELIGKLDEPTLRMLRTVFYQDELSQENFDRLKSVITIDLVTVLKRVFTPRLDWNEPLFTMPNRWSNPRYEGVLCAEVRLAVAGRQKAIRFMENGIQRMLNIVSGDGKPLELVADIHVKKDYASMGNEESKIEVVAMQDSIAFLESSIMALLLYVMSPEDKDEIIKRLRQDSTK
jgi:hypothetical protein